MWLADTFSIQNLANLTMESVYMHGCDGDKIYGCAHGEEEVQCCGGEGVHCYGMG